MGALIRTVRGWLPEGGALPDEVWAQRHRGILTLLWLHVPTIVIFALSRHQTLQHSVGEATIVGFLATMATTLRSRRRLSTVITAVGLLTCSAVFVHLSNGMIEMHFHFFVMVGVVTLYQDWWPFLVSIGYVVLQHGVAGAIAPGSVYNHHAAIAHPWKWAGIHGTFILGMSSAGIASWRLNEALLRTAAERSRKLSEAQQVAKVGSWEWDVVTGEIIWSAELCRLLGVPVDATPSYDTFIMRVHPDDQALVASSVRQAIAEGTPFARDYRLLLDDGSIRWLHGRADVSTWDGDAVRVLAGTALDVTERKRSEAELLNTLSLLGATLDATADGILVVDLEGNINSSNRRFAELWRVPEELLASRDDAAVMSSVVEQLVDPAAFVGKVRELYGRPQLASHDTIEFKDGRVFERDSMPQRVDGVVVGRVWSFRDITERKRLADELAHQAFHDSLTGLANQALFRDRVEHALARAARGDGQLAVLFIDLDRFKTVNDSLGHTAGDDLLNSVAARLQSCLKAGDTAARLGGDEYAGLLEDLRDQREAEIVADRLLKAMTPAFAVAGRDVVVSASIGIAHADDGIDCNQLLSNADLAMYTAKARGRGRSESFEADMHTAAVERLELEGDLRRALEHHELAVHYQPIVAIDNGRITGVEALVRWRHPERGELSPAVFVPLAEETGLVGELGRQVLTEACRQARVWQLEHASARHLSVSVNVSPRQLQDDVLITHVADALAASGLDPAHLVLEITEGAMMHDTESAIARLTELKRLGVRLAVDDFGTGYSSLSYLERFPVDLLKIDRSFVAAIESTGDESSLAKAIVSLAHTLQLQAVAEGVETTNQLDVLAELGCHLAQGFLLARPQEAVALGQLLTEADHKTGVTGEPEATKY